MLNISNLTFELHDQLRICMCMVLDTHIIIS